MPESSFCSASLAGVEAATASTDALAGAVVFIRRLGFAGVSAGAAFVAGSAAVRTPRTNPGSLGLSAPGSSAKGVE